MDIMQQGGSSGSPVFQQDQPLVVGMIERGIPGLNYTIALPSKVLKRALESFIGSAALDFTGIRTMEQLRRENEFEAQMDWRQIGTVILNRLGDDPAR